MPKKAKPAEIKSNKEKKTVKELKKNLSQEEINSLEQMIKENEVRTNSSEIKELLREQLTEISTPSLKKVNPPQKSQIILERDIITGSVSLENINGNEEEIKYNPLNKKDEQEYKKISPEYSEMQKESLENNPNILIKPSSFITQGKVNFADSFPNKSFKLIVADELKNSKDNNKDYVFTQSFEEKDKKFSRNPFEVKEKKYNNF
jgi:hypothetical protein